MKSRNLYSYLVEREHIRKIATAKSSAHRKYHSDEHNADYDLTNAVDFLCDIGTPIRVALEGKVVHVQDNALRAG